MAEQGELGIASCMLLRAATRQRFGPVAAAAFVLLTALQFHLPFYMSRPLPNTFAAVITNVALAHWIRGGKPYRVVALLTLATVRCVRAVQQKYRRTIALRMVQKYLSPRGCIFSATLILHGCHLPRHVCLVDRHATCIG
jgi:hypothetical protein